MYLRNVEPALYSVSNFCSSVKMWYTCSCEMTTVSVMPFIFYHRFFNTANEIRFNKSEVFVTFRCLLRDSQNYISNRVVLYKSTRVPLFVKFPFALNIFHKNGKISTSTIFDFPHLKAHETHKFLTGDKKLIKWQILKLTVDYRKYEFYNTLNILATDSNPSVF